jgi:hypothetical protein
MASDRQRASRNFAQWDFHAEVAEGRGGAEDRERPRRRDRLDADPKVFALGVVAGAGRRAGAQGSTRTAVLRALRGLRVNALAERPRRTEPSPHNQGALSGDDRDSSTRSARSE